MEAKKNQELFETFQICRNTHEDKVDLFIFCIDYQTRPTDFQKLSPDEFCSKLYEVQDLYNYKILTAHLQALTHNVWIFITESSSATRFNIPFMKNDFKVYSWSILYYLHIEEHFKIWKKIPLINRHKLFKWNFRTLRNSTKA